MTRLEYRRRLEGLTQEALGAKILYGRNTISRLERDRPSRDDVHIRVRTALETYFGESFEALMQPVQDTLANNGGASEAP